MNYINNSKLINSWKNGTTGFPLIDASMKCLIENGWVNFRMRAYVSFVFGHYLAELEKGVYHLAKLFLITSFRNSFYSISMQQYV